MNRVCVGLLLCAAICAGAAIQDQKAREGQPALAGLSFMAGHWRTETDGNSIEEAWLPPRGGLMLGLSRTVEHGSAQFEYLRIEEGDGQPTYIASPGGKGATPFPLASLTDTKAVFENPEHDFPKRIIYERKGDAMTARIEGDNDQAMSWTWKLATKLD
jgi:hypothetical protein